MPRIHFGRQAYQARSLPLNAQRCVNLYLEFAPEDSKAPDVLYGTPGMQLFADLGDDPIYGMHVLNGALYAISGNSAYSVNSAGGGTPLGSLGNVDSAVMMADNRIDIIALKSNGDAYLVDSSSVTQITDGDYQSASSVTVLDGFAVFTVDGSDQFFISALNDASAYDALDFATAEQYPDNLVRAFAKNGELWLFGGLSTEIWTNIGDGDFPFERKNGTTMQRGCAAKFSVASYNNEAFWLGDDRVVYQSRGYSPVRISTHAIEKAIGDMATISDAEGSVYTQEGHTFYVLTFPTELVTYVYDLTTGLWHQRQSFEKGRWRAAHYAFCYGKHLVGDFESGKIYELDLDIYTENTTIIQRIVASPPLSEEDQRITHDSLFVDFDTGVGLLTGQGSNPQAMLRFSDDGGLTWSSEKWRSIGKTGKYKDRAVWRRLGQARSRVYELTVSDPVKVAIKGAYATARIGNV